MLLNLPPPSSLPPLPVPRHQPPLDPGFRPFSLALRDFATRVKAAGVSEPLVIGLERGPESFSTYRTEIFALRHEEENLRMVERLVKFLLWQKGAHRVVIGGPQPLADALAKIYAPGGARAFDAAFMARVYEKPFRVDRVAPTAVPAPREAAVPRGGHLDGCRIGLDLGASDRKVAAVVDGAPAFTEEVVWMPRDRKDPGWHLDQIQSALKAAGARMPRVDAIGVSTAGVVIDNRIMVASLFRGVPDELFASRVKGIFQEVQRLWGGIPVEVANDGDVTALAGSMSLGAGGVLGVAMGSSQAAGYVTPARTLTDWLSELAFAPVDLREDAPADEWSGDRGVGVQYFSQVAGGRLAAAAGIPGAAGASPAERLKEIQAAHAAGDERAAQVFDSIGCFLGYAIAQYAAFYDLHHVLVLGRVTSGKGGTLVVDRAKRVLLDEFPELAGKVALHMPEGEIERRHGQAVAAASLPAAGGAR